MSQPPTIQNPKHVTPTIQTPDEQFRTSMLYYARRTASATQFIAWFIGICAVLGLIGILYTGIQIAKVGNSFSQVGGDISTCQSLGGTDPSC